MDDCFVRDVRIGTGNDVGSTPGLTTSQTTYVFDGDLAYWGLTEGEAQDFVDGNERLRFEATNSSATQNNEVQVQWAKCSILFDAPTGPVPGPVLF